MRLWFTKVAPWLGAVRSASEGRGIDCVGRRLAQQARGKARSSPGEARSPATISGFFQALACASICACGYVAGITDREPPAAGASGATPAGTGASAGASGADAASGGADPDGAAADGAAADGSSGAPIGPEADAPASEQPACPSFGFVQNQITWQLREGQNVQEAVLDVALALGGGALSDWAVGASGAKPAWVSVPSAPTSPTSLAIKTFSGVPYTAYPGPPSFDVSLAPIARPECVSKVTVKLAMTNVLHVVSPVGSMPTAIDAAAYQPGLDRFVLLSTAARSAYVLTLGDSPQVGGGIILPVLGQLASAIGATKDHVYVLTADSLHRFGPNADGADEAVSICAATGYRSVAAARGWALVGDTGGCTALVQDGKPSPEPTTVLPDKIGSVTTDGQGFAFKTAGPNGWDLYRLDGVEMPPSVLPSACAPEVEADGLALDGRRLAVRQGVASPSVKLFDWTSGCVTFGSIPLPSGQSAPSAVHLTGDHVFASPRFASGSPGHVDLQLYAVPGGQVVGEGLTQQPVFGVVVRGLLGSGRYGLVVTSTPLLVEL
jgi:hypothetical protein